MNEEPGFYSLGIAPNILETLDRLGFKKPTPIQEKSIPSGLEGKDLIGIAQTGTGKTLAFGIPLLQHALANKNSLVVLPTRELAFQVREAIEKVAGRTRVRMATLIGGEPIYRQIRALQAHPEIIIGTPGRIIDHLNQKTLSLSKISTLVLDEADRMLDMGFAKPLARILETVPKERQTMLFSATMPSEIVTIAKKHMRLPLQIEIARPGTTAERVTQELFFVQKPDKFRLLENLLAKYRGSVLVFSRTKHGAKRINRDIRDLNHTCAELHSNRSLSQRKEALEGFRNGRYRVLVATDIAARGIDVKGIELVVNFDLPQSPEDYVHRIGRTGRASGAGHAISFATPDQRRDVQDIERLIKAALPLSPLPELPPARQQAYVPRDNPAPWGAPRPTSHFAHRRNTSSSYGRPQTTATPAETRQHRGGPSRFSSPRPPAKNPNKKFENNGRRRPFAPRPPRPSYRPTDK